jgi:hypothetical protein
MPRKSAAETEANVLRLASTGGPPKLTPPSILSTDEQSLFTQLRAANKHLTDTDTPMLVAYVQAVTQTHRLGKAKNLKVGDFERVARVMMSLAGKLKLCPSSDRRVDRTGGVGLHWQQLAEMNEEPVTRRPWDDDSDEPESDGA